MRFVGRETFADLIDLQNGHAVRRQAQRDALVLQRQATPFQNVFLCFETVHRVHFIDM